MPFIFLGLFLMLPIFEIATFIAVGSEVGILGTLFLCILSAVAGGMIVQKQGIDTLFRGRETLESGQFPGQALFDGVCIALAGALLILPGFISDAIGFALLLPPVRAALRHYLARHMKDVSVETRTYTHPARDAGVVEGTFERLDDHPGPDRRIGS